MDDPGEDQHRQGVHRGPLPVRANWTTLPDDPGGHPTDASRAVGVAEARPGEVDDGWGRDETSPSDLAADPDAVPA